MWSNLIKIILLTSIPIKAFEMGLNNYGPNNMPDGFPLIPYGYINSALDSKEDTVYYNKLMDQYHSALRNNDIDKANENVDEINSLINKDASPEDVGKFASYLISRIENSKGGEKVDAVSSDALVLLRNEEAQSDYMSLDWAIQGIVQMADQQADSGHHSIPMSTPGAATSIHEGDDSNDGNLNVADNIYTGEASANSHSVLLTNTIVAVALLLVSFI